MKKAFHITYNGLLQNDTIYVLKKGREAWVRGSIYTKVLILMTSGKSGVETKGENTSLYKFL